MDSVVGRNVIVQVRGQLLPAVIRASTEPLTATSDFSKSEVLLEWEGEGKGRREWLSLSDATKCQAVYMETKLLWAKRLITVDQQRRAVAWPAKAYSLLCSNVQQYTEVMIVEYFCDRERVQLYVQESQQETKELHLSEAKGTLISHPFLLAELEEWEESQRDHTLLVSGQTNLVGQTVGVCTIRGAWPQWIICTVTAHNQQTKELSVCEEGSGSGRVVNPLLVHVVLRPPAGCGDAGLQRTTPHPMQSHMSNPDHLLLDGPTDTSLISPHLSSPSLQETPSPLFTNLTSSSSPSPITAYRTPSIDLHRRSSLQYSIDSSRMSEPNIFRRSSLDPLSAQKPGGLFNFHQEGNAYASPLVHSPTAHLMQGGSTHSSQQGTAIGQTSRDLPGLPSPLHGVERSKSLDNITHSLQPLATHSFKRRMSAQIPLPGAPPTKRPRYELIPTISGDLRTSPEPSLPSSLHRSMSLSALPRRSHHHFPVAGRGHSTSDNRDDDELDMIKEIIDRDDPIVGHTHHHSLTNIPAEMSVSLPVLHPSEGLQVLNTYNSAPVIASSSSSSSSSSLHPVPPDKASPSSTDILLPDVVSGVNGAISDFLSDTLQPHKESSFTSDIFPFSTSSTNPTQSYNTLPSNPAHCIQSDSTHSATPTEQKPPLLNFTPGETSSHPHSPHLPNLTEMLQTMEEPAPPHSSSLLRSALSTPVYPMTSSDGRAEAAHIAREAEVLGGERVGREEVLVGEGEGGDVGALREGGELDIAVIVNQHASMATPTVTTPTEERREEGGGGGEEPRRTKQVKSAAKEVRSGVGTGVKRGRGRPRLTEEEKQRRKELRELGLMKRSHRRTKEEVAQWKAERLLSPAKRGRKPGSGKKNVVKAVTGKEVYVSVDLSKYEPGTVLLQNGFCRAFPGVSRCMECSTSDGDLPSNRYCRFLEFRKIRIVDSIEPKLEVEGFATYTDVQAADLVPWTPLKTGYSHMDTESALLILRRVAPQFVGVVSAEAATLPEGEVTPVWKRAVQGLREMCDTCDTAIFNFHWICPQCGFCICPACYQVAWDLEEGYDVPSSTHRAWPSCVSTSTPHLPSSLIVAHIIPANVLSDVLSRMLKICEAQHIRLEVPRPLQQLISLISRQTLQSRFQNDRKGKGARSRSGKSSMELGGSESSLTSPLGSLQSSPLGSSPLPPLTSSSHPNGTEQAVFPSTVPHSWLCDGTLLCLHDPVREDNMAAFQHQWRRGAPVLVAGVDRQLTSGMWTPQSFGRDFRDDYSELVDCRQSFPLPHYPSHVFWDGFDDMSQRLRDTRSGEPRLLKQKDWPPGEDFSEKLPKRFADLMSALPLPHYTRRDGKLNMASSLPGFFVKPDMGPKMYNAYGSPAYPSCGTTNLHLDISDATNVMVYCSIAAGAEGEEESIRETIKSECCQQTYWRCTSNALKVGALWHIYAASDTDTIRTFLRKVFDERGMKPVTRTDPIHDQLIYLDSDLRQRLSEEYGVHGWAIAQAVGDAIFIPAGAPHQVRNLCNCIKVAEDFVSPEHVSECVKLTEEFRQLSDGHVNHEDKLQVKNIMYHSIKDVVGVLNSTVK